MKYSAIIFDLDGTIIDTEPIWAKSNMQMLAAKGIILKPIDQKKLQNKLQGLGIQNACQEIKESLGLSDSIEKLMEEQAIFSSKLFSEGIQFMSGFQAFHKKITNLRLKNGIATNATLKTIEIAQRSLKLDKFFGKHIYCPAHIGNIGKPNPALFLHTAKQLKIAPEKCIVIEDSSCGIKGAKAAGMFTIGINTNKNQELIQSADIIVEKYKEIDLNSILN
jgi:HAD superfamily hydrolase (TIGR01509 family)